MLIINCPECRKPVMLTKNGQVPNHGRRYFHSNIRGFNIIETCPVCPGSGQKPKQGGLNREYMEDETIFELRREVNKQSNTVAYAKDLVLPLIDEIIRLRCKYEDMVDPDDKMENEWT